MKIFILLSFAVIIFISGCATSGKSYRDATGVIKTETRDTEGVNK